MRDGFEGFTKIKNFFKWSSIRSPFTLDDKLPETRFLLYK